MSKVQLHKYIYPKWAETLLNIPKFRLQLINGKTPIDEWDLKNVPEKFKLFIKRDDMTGSTLSGNKVRKLEFLLADALNQKCRDVITCGGIQSNHCRATVIAARQLGLKPHVFLRTDELDKPDGIKLTGNLFLNLICRAQTYLVPKKAPYETELKPRMNRLAAKIKSETGCDVYQIPVGGSDNVGVFGYITMFEELIQQGALDSFDDVITTCGSGGTSAGICIANYLTGSKLRCHAIIICDEKKYFYDHINCSLVTLGLNDVRAEDIIDVIEGHKGQGYGISTAEDHEFIMDTAARTGIILDPVYTGKAARGLVYELNNNPTRFKGHRIMFVHTGGVFGLMDGRLDVVGVQEQNPFTVWKDKDTLPWE